MFYIKRIGGIFIKKLNFTFILTGCLLFLSFPSLISANENINWNIEFKRAEQVTQDTKRNLRKIVKQKLEPSPIFDTTTAVSTLSTSKNFFKPKIGQILATLDNGSASFRWGHAAILETSTITIEEWPKDKNHKDGVYRYTYKGWRDNVKNYVVLNVNKAKYNQYKGAVSFAKSKIKMPFNLKTTKDSDKAYYCSKLVYRSWKSVKVDLDNDAKVFVTPADIIRDKDTKVTYQKGMVKL